MHVHKHLYTHIDICILVWINKCVAGHLELNISRISIRNFQYIFDLTSPTELNTRK